MVLFVLAFVLLISISNCVTFLLPIGRTVQFFCFHPIAFKQDDMVYFPSVSSIVLPMNSNERDGIRCYETLPQKKNGSKSVRFLVSTHS